MKRESRRRYIRKSETEVAGLEMLTFVSNHDRTSKGVMNETETRQILNHRCPASVLDKPPLP